MAGDLRVVDLDFDQVKENLKTFLKNQDYFTDYDFEGSALSIILDMLAYDTHYKAYLANMVINERFIDTAVKRASVVSHAKPLGYVPRSARAARAVVDIAVYGISNEYTMSIDKFTPFETYINGVTYTFVTTKSYTTTPSGEYNAYTFKNVELFEGTPLTYNYSVPNSSIGQLFKIPAMNVDTTTLTVTVQTSATDTTTSLYDYADSVSLLDGNDKVYFLQEGTDGYYYIYFGDGVLGAPIQSGNIIKLAYVVTTGSAVNTSTFYNQTFSLSGMIGGYTSSNAIITLLSTSAGGAEKQGTDEIRFIAPKNYSAQGRTVTAQDFKTLLVKDFPEIDSISVWGGEDNVPPIYGKVFIAIKPKDGYVISSTTKDYIIKYLRERSIVSIQVEFVDPDFTFISVVSNVKYNSGLTIKESTDIANMVNSTIQSFFANTLQQFGKNLYVSRLQSIIDNLEPSILGNSITLGLQKRIEPVVSLNSSYTLYFNNKIAPYSLQSTAFNVLGSNGTVTAAIKDIPDTTPPNVNGTGTLVLFDITTNNTINQNMGTINYATGVVTIKSLLVVSFPSISIYDIRVNVKPQSQVDEISYSIILDQATAATIPVSMQNQILMLDDSVAVPAYYLNNGLTVTAVPISE